MLTPEEYTFLQHCGWTPEELAIAMPKELRDALRKERVMAAAPDMLAALKALVQSDIVASEWGHEALDAARAAIAKAEGK